MWIECLVIDRFHAGQPVQLNRNRQLLNTAREVSVNLDVSLSLSRTLEGILADIIRYLVSRTRV